MGRLNRTERFGNRIDGIPHERIPMNTIGSYTHEDRFEPYELWKKTIEMTLNCLFISSRLKREGHLSVSNSLLDSAIRFYQNMADSFEGKDRRDYPLYLSLARKAVCEIGGILILMVQKKWLKKEDQNQLMSILIEINRVIGHSVRNLSCLNYS